MNHENFRLFKSDMPVLVVIDAEYRFDHAAHARYRAAERFTPGKGPRKGNKDPLIVPRWPCREIVAFSWLVMSDGGDDGLTPTKIETRGLPEQDEKAILTDFFQDISTLGTSVRLVTWGGSAADIPPLLLATAKHGLRLPASLKGLQQRGRRMAPCHIDLMRDIAGDAARPHLAEVAAALNIPAKTICRPDHVSRLMRQGKWSLVKSVAESDVLTTAMILMLHRQAIGAGESVLQSKQRLANLVRKKREYRSYAAEWICIGDQALAEQIAEQNRLLPILAPAFSI